MAKNRNYIKNEEFCKNFIDEYIRNGDNATKAYAAVNPGVTLDSANVEGPKFKRRVDKIPEYVEYEKEQRRKLSEKTNITAQRVAEELAKIAFVEYPEDSAFEIRVSDKNKSLELLGKYLGMFTEKQIVAQTSLEEYLNKFGDDYEY